MSAKSRGIAREHQAKRWLEDQGWWVQRGPASLGVDLVCLRPREGGGCEGRFVEVKSNRGSPYMNFRAEERAALLREAKKAGTTAALLHWPPRGEPTLVASGFWPSAVTS